MEKVSEEQKSKLVKICRELDPFAPIPPEDEKVLRELCLCSTSNAK